MPVDFLTFLSQINDAVIAEDGHDLGFLLKPTTRHGKDLVKEFLPATVSSWYCIRTAEAEQVYSGRKALWRSMKVSSLAPGTRSQYLMSWLARMLPWRGQEKRSRNILSLYRAFLLFCASSQILHFFPDYWIDCSDHFLASSQRTGAGHCLHYFRSWEVWEIWLLMCVPWSCMTKLVCSLNQKHTGRHGCKI